VAANTQYEVPTWNQIYDMLLDQAQKIQGDGYKPDIIIGIARGGIVSARILSDLLEVPDLATIQIEYYADIAQTKQEPILKRSLHTQLTGKKALLVDDVSDSGKSLQLAKNHLQQQGAKEIKTATLYAKPQTITEPDYYEKQTSHWIVFPWDAKETVREIIQKHEGKRATSKEIAKLVRAGLPKQLAEKFLKDMQ
jgi:uncharacterized protein